MIFNINLSKMRIQASCLTFILLFCVKANAEIQGEEFIVTLAKEMIAYTANQILQKEDELAQDDTNLISPVSKVMVESIPNWIMSNEAMLVKAIENATVTDEQILFNEYDLAANMVNVIAKQITIHQAELTQIAGTKLPTKTTNAFSNPGIPLVRTWIKLQKDNFAEAVVDKLRDDDRR